MDTVSVAFDPGEICGVVLPVHEVAAVVVGFVHSLKSCGIWPPFVTVNVTEPCATVFVDSLKPNSEGFAAVTVTVAAARVDFAAATGTTTTSTRAAAASSSVRTCFMRLLDLGRAHREAAPGLRHQSRTDFRIWSEDRFVNRRGRARAGRRRSGAPSAPPARPAGAPGAAGRGRS